MQSRALIHFSRASAVVMLVFLLTSAAVAAFGCCCQSLCASFQTADEENAAYNEDCPQAGRPRPLCPSPRTLLPPPPEFRNMGCRRPLHRLPKQIGWLLKNRLRKNNAVTARLLGTVNLYMQGCFRGAVADHRAMPLGTVDSYCRHS